MPTATIVAALTATLGVGILFFVVAGRAGRNISDAETFYAGSKNISKGEYDNTYLATNVTFTAVLLLLAEVGYQYEWWALAAPGAWIGGMFWVRHVFLEKLIPSFSEGNMPRTLHEYCADRLLGSSLIRRVLALVTIIAFVGTVATEAIGLVYAFSTFGVVNEVALPAVVLAIVVILVLYARRSGFDGVVATDVIQTRLVAATGVVLGIIVVLLFLWQPPFPISPAVATRTITFSEGAIAAFGFLILFVPFNLCVSDMWQRCYAARWNKDVVSEIASWRMIVSFFILFTIPVSIGIAASHIGIPKAGGSDFILLKVVDIVLDDLPLAVSFVVVFILSAGFVAGALSTGDTLLVNAGFIYEYDWKQSHDLDEEGLRGTKEAAGVFGVASMIFVAPEFLSDSFSLVDVAYGVFSNQIAFTPILLLSIYASARMRSGPNNVLVWALVISFLTCFLVVSYGSLNGDDVLVSSAPILGLIVTIVGLAWYWTQVPKRKS